MLSCKKCGKHIQATDKHYEIDIYRFGFGLNINFSDEIIVCEDCFESLDWLRKGDDKNADNSVTEQDS